MNFQAQKFSPRGLHPTGYKIIIPLSSTKSKPSVSQKRYFIGKSVAPLPKNPRLINAKARGKKKATPAKPTRRKVPSKKKKKRRVVKRAPKKKKKGYRKPAKKVKKRAKKRPQKRAPKRSLAKKKKKKGRKRTIFD